MVTAYDLGFRLAKPRRPAKTTKAQRAKAVRTILAALKKRLKLTKPTKAEAQLLRRAARDIESSKRQLNIKWPLWGLRKATDRFKREMKRRKVVKRARREGQGSWYGSDGP